MIDASTLENKRQQHRLEIRKASHNTLLREKRTYILQTLQDQLELITIPKDQLSNYIEEMARRFCGEPSPQWKQNIQHLKQIVFNYIHDFSDWFESGLIRSLSQVFRPQYKYLKGFLEVASLINRMLVSCKDVSFPYTGRLVANYSIVDGAIELCFQPHTSFQQIAPLVEMLANIASDELDCRTALIEKQLPELVDFLIQSYTQENALIIILELLANSMIDQDAQGKYYNTLSRFLPWLSKFIMSQNTSILKPVLRAIYHLSKPKKVDKHGSKTTPGAIYTISNMYHAANIVPRMIQLLQHPQVSISLHSMKTIALIASSNNNNYSSSLVRQGVLDKLEIYIQGASVRSYIYQAFWAVANFALNSSFQAQIVREHPLFDRAIEFTKQCYAIQTRQAAYYILQAVIRHSKHQELSQFLEPKNVLRILVDGLDAGEISPNIIDSSLISIFYAVVSYSRTYTAEGPNPLAIELECKYNISDRIQMLLDNPNPKISHLSQKLLECIAHNLVQK